MNELIGSPFSIDQPGGKVTIDYAGRMGVLEGLLQCLGYDPDQGRLLAPHRCNFCKPHSWLGGRVERSTALYRPLNESERSLLCRE